MDTTHRTNLQRTLRHLAESYAATMGLMERTFALLCQDLSTDAPGTPLPSAPQNRLRPIVDQDTFTVTFRGRTCFLGNTLPFRLFARLAVRPNVCVARAALLAEVWQGTRSDSSVRSTVKILRRRLRSAGLTVLADAIDGSVSGHYRLRLSQ
jgi:hypothetical protein